MGGRLPALLEKSCAMNVYAIALLVAFATGLRTFTPLAALCWRAGNWTTVVSIIFALSELVTDKLPAAPARTQPLSLVLRGLVAVYVANAVAQPTGIPLWQTALLALTGMLIGAFAGYGWRTKVAPSAQIPPFLAAVVEDGVAIVVAVWAFFGAH
jgi:uncharacterized membrane protein